MLNKQLVIWMLQDMAQCDNYRLELTVLRERDSINTDVIGKQSQVISRLTAQYKDIKTAYDTCIDAKSDCEINLHLSERKVTKITRQRNYIMAGFAAVVGLFLVK